jgi:hypothetical protein
VTSVSTASQSIASRDERLFPNTPEAFLATMYSTSLRTRANDPISKKSVAEADPSRSASSGGKDASGTIVHEQALALDVHQRRERSTGCGVVTGAIHAGHQTGDVHDVTNGDEDNASREPDELALDLARRPTTTSLLPTKWTSLAYRGPLYRTRCPPPIVSSEPSD